MRASCEWALKNESDTIPFIRLRIYKTDDDITLKISDRGGGMSRRTKKKIFNYMYSTATDKVSYEGIGGGSYGGGISASTLPMHGLGYGLPLSRLYARYFRGDIKVFILNNLYIAWDMDFHSTGLMPDHIFQRRYQGFILKKSI